MVDDSNQTPLTLGQENTPVASALEALLAANAEPSWWHIDSRRYGVVIGGLHVLLPAGLESEVLEEVKPTRLPRAPAELLGITNVRGTLLPVFDLSLLADWPQALQTSPSAKRQIVMVGTGVEAYGLSVTGLPQALRDLVGETGMEPPLALSNHFASAWRTPDGTIWFELQIANLLAERAASLSERSEVALHAPNMKTEEEFT